MIPCTIRAAARKPSVRNCRPQTPPLNAQGRGPKSHPSVVLRDHPGLWSRAAHPQRSPPIRGTRGARGIVRRRSAHSTSPIPRIATAPLSMSLLSRRRPSLWWHNTARPQLPDTQQRPSGAGYPPKRGLAGTRTFKCDRQRWMSPKSPDWPLSFLEHPGRRCAELSAWRRATRRNGGGSPSVS